MESPGFLCLCSARVLHNDLDLLNKTGQGWARHIWIPVHWPWDHLSLHCEWQHCCGICSRPMCSVVIWEDFIWWTKLWFGRTIWWTKLLWFGRTLSGGLSWLATAINNRGNQCVLNSCGNVQIFCAATPLKRTLSGGLGRGGRFWSCKHVADLTLWRRT